MINKNIAKKINQRFYYGWIIIVMSALSVFFSSPGQTYSISTFINSYIADFGYSRTQISTIYSTATIISGSLLVLMGRAVDRKGQRVMMAIAGTMLAMACFFNSFIVNLQMMFFGFFMLRYFGQGSLTLIPGSLVPQWFEKRRALAISLYNLGGMFANMLIPAANFWFISQYGWQMAWRGWGLILLVLFVPMAWLFVVNRPEDIELLPDNQKVEHSDDLDKELDKMIRDSWTLSEAVKTKEFWFIGTISMIVPMVSTGLMFHFFSIMSLQGISETASSFVIGLVALPGFIMPLIANFIIDRFRSKFIIITTLSIIMLDLLFMLMVSSSFTASIFMLIYGLAVSIQNVTLGVIWVKYFGRLHLGSIRGAATVFTVIGSALGPLPFGLSFDLTGSYFSVFIAMALASFAGLILALSIKKPQKV